MNRRQSASALAAATLLAGGFAFSSAARADLPKAQQANIKAMDKNKNGRIEKEEFITAMAEMFDRSAGAKGYCTFEEVAQSFVNMKELYGGS